MNESYALAPSGQAPFDTTQLQLTLRTGETSPFPSLILQEGEGAARAYLNFFTAEIENDNTRAAYVRAVNSFMDWCEARGVTLKQVEPWMMATYIKGHRGKPATVKQHLAAIRRLFDHLYVERVMESNPASPVRGPKSPFQNPNFSTKRQQMRAQPRSRKA